MLNMLEYIRINYNTHFKDLKINAIENIDINMLGYDDQGMSDTKSIFTGSEKTNQLSQMKYEKESDSKSEIIGRESGAQSSLEYDKNRVSGRQSKDPLFNLSKHSMSTKEIYLICGAGQIEPYKKFISLDLHRAN